MSTIKDVLPQDLKVGDTIVACKHPYKKYYNHSSWKHDNYTIRAIDKSIVKADNYVVSEGQRGHDILILQFDNSASWAPVFEGERVYKFLIERT